MPDVLCYEKKAWASGFLRVAGVDEAGRGPLAGPVVAAAVVFEVETLKDGVPDLFLELTDSKALSERQRETFFQQLSDLDSVCIGVGVVDAETIDQINILRSTHRAMAEAAQEVNPDFILVDGLPVKGLPAPSESIVKGDAKSFLISAASVIAKVTRDRMMQELDRCYPEYGFARHKGYGTKEHLVALKKWGACPAHRQTFRPVADLRQMNLGF